MADARDFTILQAREVEFGIQLLTQEFSFADMSSLEEDWM
jgi:hypothetical protein